MFLTMARPSSVPTQLSFSSLRTVACSTAVHGKLVAPRVFHASDRIPGKAHTFDTHVTCVEAAWLGCMPHW